MYKTIIETFITNACEYANEREEEIVMPRHIIVMLDNVYEEIWINTIPLKKEKKYLVK